MSHTPAEPTRALTSITRSADETPVVRDASQLDEELVRDVIEESDTRGMIGAVGAALVLAPLLWFGPVGLGSTALVLAGATVVGAAMEAMRLRAASRSTGVAPRLLARVELVFHIETARLAAEDVRAGRLRLLATRSSATTREVVAPRVLARLAPRP